jgi:hypothetical protein
MFSSSDPDPHAKSNTRSSLLRGPVFGSWLSSVTIALRMSLIRCGVKSSPAFIPLPAAS